MNKLSFKTLREANTARLPLFKNAKGETQHSGSDWSLTDWMTALAGEVGEAANLIKKYRRGDYEPGDHEFYNQLASELADVQIYLDLLARDAGIDLGVATVEKFNSKSTKLQLPVYFALDGSGYMNYDTGYNVRPHTVKLPDDVQTVRIPDNAHTEIIGELYEPADRLVEEIKKATAAQVESTNDLMDMMREMLEKARASAEKPELTVCGPGKEPDAIVNCEKLRVVSSDMYDFKPETQVAGDRLLVSLPKPKEECRSEGIVDNAMVVFVNDTLAFHYEIPDPGKGYVWHRSVKNLPASELTGFTNVYRHYWVYSKEWGFRHLRYGKFLIVELPHADSAVTDYVDSDDDILDISYAEFSGEIQLGKNERIKRTVIEPMDENYDIMNAAGLLTFGCDFTDFVIFEIY